jgi:hypothetical protein
LRHRIRRQILRVYLRGNLLLPLSAVVLAVTWVLAYLALFHLLRPVLGSRHWSYPVGATLVIPLVFHLHRRRPPGRPMERLPGLERKGWARLKPLTGDQLRYLGRLTMDTLVLGPELMAQAFRLISKTQRLIQVNEHAAALILEWLAETDRKVPIADIEARLRARGLPVRIAELIRDLDGVLTLGQNPTGLGLSPDLRKDLEAARERGAGKKSSPGP